MLQDIAPQVYHNEFYIRTPQSQDHFFYIKDGRILLDPTIDHFPFPSFQAFALKQPDIYQHADYLFSISQHDFYLIDEQAIQLDESDGYLFSAPTILRTLTPSWTGFAGVYNGTMN